MTLVLRTVEPTPTLLFRHLFISHPPNRVRTGREVRVILHDIEVVGSLLAWRASLRDSNTLWHLTAVIVHGQGVVVGVYEQVGWPQCVKTRCEGRRVGDTGCLSAGGGEVNV